MPGNVTPKGYRRIRHGGRLHWSTTSYQSAIAYRADDGSTVLLLFFREDPPTLDSELAFFCVPPR